MNDVYLSLGSNEGDRVLWLQKAIELLAVQCGVVVQQSAVYETAAWGITDQAAFLNMAVQMQTTLTAAEVLKEILEIETLLGRQRDVKWGPRTLDIDILLFNNDIIDTEALTVPHPYLHERRFTLLPLAEIAPAMEHPRLHATMSELLRNCRDALEVTIYEAR
ncbi:MAG: 2-amino-4-hydroxy-6-hydroxymethyldihydropteridine diphosphokinase [Bacteroidota bacterium]